MSRTKTPWIAAKKTEQSRRQLRKERLMLTGIILLMIASMVIYGFYLKYFYFSKPGHRQKPAASDASAR